VDICTHIVIFYLFIRSFLLDTDFSAWQFSSLSLCGSRYDLDQDEKIGLGFFSDVFRGMWRGRVVAIKVLADVTPRKLFVREVKIWQNLKHENVLEVGSLSLTLDLSVLRLSPDISCFIHLCLLASLF
jgi:hypothetical protein